MNVYVPIIIELMPLAGDWMLTDGHVVTASRWACLSNKYD